MFVHCVNYYYFSENYLGHMVKNAVVTVPAYFNDSQRQVKTAKKPNIFLCRSFIVKSERSIKPISLVLYAINLLRHSECATLGYTV